jgi:hypothetical protein
LGGASQDFKENILVSIQEEKNPSPWGCSTEQESVIIRWYRRRIDAN